MDFFNGLEKSISDVFYRVICLSGQTEIWSGLRSTQSYESASFTQNQHFLSAFYLVQHTQHHLHTPSHFRKTYFLFLMNCGL